MRWIDLSHPITSGMDQYPGDVRPVRLIRDSRHDRDGLQTTSLEIGCHAGTHLDAPLHFLAGAAGVDTLPLAACAGWARVVDVRGPGRAIGRDRVPVDALHDVAFVLLRTGWSAHWGTPQYYRDWPHVGPEFARAAADLGLRGLGLDTPSLDPHGGRACHDLCAAAGMVNLENLTSLDALPDGRFLLVALPLKLAAGEASPVRAAALLDLPAAGAGPPKGAS